MEFRIPYKSYSEEHETPSGEKIVLEHEEIIDLKGKRSLTATREVNIYERIQASRESTEIETILRRATEGDYNALSMVNGNYIDITGAPASLAEAQQFVIHAKNQFDELPKEIRAKFENNAEMYVASYGSDEWQEKTGIKMQLEKEAAEAERQAKFNVNMEKAFENLAEQGAMNNE